MLRKGKPIKKRKLQCELLFPAMSPSAFDVKQTRSGSRSPREQFWWHSREWNQTAVRGISEPRARASGKMASPLSPKGSSHYRIDQFWGVSGALSSDQGPNGSGNITHMLSLQGVNLYEARGCLDSSLHQTYSVQWGQKFKFTDNESCGQNQPKDKAQACRA